MIVKDIIETLKRNFDIRSIYYISGTLGETIISLYRIDKHGLVSCKGRHDINKKHKEGHIMNLFVIDSFSDGIPRYDFHIVLYTIEGDEETIYRVIPRNLDSLNPWAFNPNDVLIESTNCNMRPYCFDVGYSECFGVEYGSLNELYNVILRNYFNIDIPVDDTVNFLSIAEKCNWLLLDIATNDVILLHNGYMNSIFIKILDNKSGIRIYEEYGKMIHDGDSHAKELDDKEALPMLKYLARKYREQIKI